MRFRLCRSFQWNISLLILEQVLELYFNQQLSLRLVADKLGTYPNKVRRFLVENGYELRDKATSQNIALDVGRSEHPTKGKKRSKKTKRKIGRAIERVWEERPPELKAALAEKSKERWHERTEQQAEEFRKKAADGVRRAGVYGTKLEQFLLARFRKHNFEPQYQREDLVFSERMRVDIFLSRDKIALEIDGPTHFTPIWGEEYLQQKIASDNKKNGLLLYCGFHVIRARIRRKTTNKTYRELVWTKIHSEVERLLDVKKPELVILEI